MHHNYILVYFVKQSSPTDIPIHVFENDNFITSSQTYLQEWNYLNNLLCTK